MRNSLRPLRGHLPQRGRLGFAAALQECKAPSLRELAAAERLTEGETTGGNPMSLPYKKNLIPRAKELRREATPQENHLWYDFLRSYPVRFQRQKTIDRFIVDFYCHAAKLVIEIDGSQHYEPQGQAYDEERTAALAKYGLYVLRFSNREINTQFQAVCEMIDTAVKRRLP